MIDKALREAIQAIDTSKDHEHLTAAELEKAVFTLDSTFTGHLAECDQCAMLVFRERDRNPLYTLFLKHPDSFWEGVEEAKKAHEHG